LTVENKKTYKDKLMIYVPPQKKTVYQKLREILKREGRSISNFFLEQAETYVRLHEPGNPQQTLPEIMKRKKAYVAPKKCGFINCERECAAVAVHESGYEMPVCSYHMHALSDEPKWRIKSYEH